MRHVFGVEALRIVIGDETGAEISADEFGVCQQSRMKRNIALHATHDEAVERLARFGNGVCPIFAMHDEFGNHRIIKHRDFTTVLHAGVDAHAIQVLRIGLPHGGFRRAETHQAPRGGQEVAEGVFGIDTALDRPTVALHLVLRQRQFFASGHAQLQFHQVQPRDALGDRVLNL